MRMRHEECWREKIEQPVGDRYAESNEAIAKLVGFDLQAFGYR